MLISRLPGNALGMLVESRGLPSDLTCVLEAEPGKLDIKIRGHIQVGSLFKLAIMAVCYLFSCRFGVFDDVIQNMQRHDYLIKTHAVT